MPGSYLPLAQMLTGQQPQPFQSGGASGSWAPQPTFSERWNQTATKQMIDDEDDRIFRKLARMGPVTRESYIDYKYDTGTLPKEWTVDHEADLPASLQNWSLFKDGRYIGPPIDE